MPQDKPAGEGTIPNIGSAMSREESFRREYAGAMLRRAIKLGQIERQPCQVGEGCYGRNEAHHYNYDWPYDVWWLCKHHHEAAHHLGLELPRATEPHPLTFKAFPYGAS